MKKWWNKKEKELDIITYQLDNVNIIIGSRLDCYGCSEDFYDSIDTFISVTDRFTFHKKTKSYYWFPWIESKTIPVEVIFAVANIFNKIRNENKTHTIYLHCDGGTHRAPSTLGSLLYIFFNDSKEEIVKKAKLNLGTNSYYYNNKEQKLYSDPLDYISRYILDYQKVNLDLINFFKKINASISKDEDISLESLLKESNLDFKKVPVK